MCGIGVRLGFGVLIVGLAAAGCGSEPPAENSTLARAPQEAPPGLSEYRSTCALCHGANGEGHPRLGKELRSSEFVRSRTDAELVEFLKEGRSATHPDNQRGVEMPPRGGNPGLTDADLAAIVAYLRSIQ